MVRVRPEKFPPGNIKKFHAKRTCPYKVLRRIGSNAYELDIPQDLGINPVFNVEDLTQYNAPNDYPAISPDSSSFLVVDPQHVSVPPRHRGDTSQKRLRTFYRMRSSR